MKCGEMTPLTEPKDWKKSKKREIYCRKEKKEK